jgi:phage N-6-adenine-methyltransferase
MKRNQKGKGNDGMLTPPRLYNQLHAVFNFELDVACTTDNCLCDAGLAYDTGCDGLTDSWEDARVFANPPFSEKAKWMLKAHWEVTEGNCPICVMILPTNSMDSAAWAEWVYGKHFYHIMTGRTSFIDPDTGKPKSGNDSGTTVVYFMKKPQKE